MQYNYEDVIGRPCVILKKVVDCMISAGFDKAEICKYMETALSKDYAWFILTSMQYIDMCNEKDNIAIRV